MNTSSLLLSLLGHQNCKTLENFIYLWWKKIHNRQLEKKKWKVIVSGGLGIKITKEIPPKIHLHFWHSINISAVSMWKNNNLWISFVYAIFSLILYAKPCLMQEWLLKYTCIQVNIHRHSYTESNEWKMKIYLIMCFTFISLWIVVLFHGTQHKFNKPNKSLLDILYILYEEHKRCWFDHDSLKQPNFVECHNLIIKT